MHKTINVQPRGLKLVEVDWYEIPVNWRLVGMIKPYGERGFFPDMLLLKELGKEPKHEENDVILTVEQAMALRKTLSAKKIQFQLYARFGVCELPFQIIRSFGGIRLSFSNQEHAEMVGAM